MDWVWELYKKYIVKQLARQGITQPTDEDLEASAVDAGQPFLGGDPEVAAARLEDRLDRALRQTVRDRPSVTRVLANGLRRWGWAMKPRRRRGFMGRSSVSLRDGFAA